MKRHLMASCVGNICTKNRCNPLILFKVTIDNIGVPFFRHSVLYHVDHLRRPMLFCFVCFVLLSVNTYVCVAEWSSSRPRYRMVLRKKSWEFSRLSHHRFYRAMHFSAKRGIVIACRPSVCPSVCLSVCPSVCDVGDLGPHRSEIWETNCTDN